MTTKILNEYEEILERLAGTEVAKLAINTILNNPKTLFCTRYYNFTIIQSDPDDNKFVDCAVVANTKFIVTEEHHFDVSKQCSFPKTDIVTLDEFMKQI